MSPGRRPLRALRLRLSRWTSDAMALPRALRLRGVVSAEPAVWYGLERVPASDEIAHGGAIKAQALQALFPDSGARCNILYLVSSALPAGAAMLARIAARRARLVLNQDGVAYPAWHGAGWQETNATLAAVLRRASHVFYQSEFCRTTADRFLGPAPGSSEVLHNAVDTARFTPPPVPPPERPVVLLLAGNQDQGYRLQLALAVLERLRKGGIEARLRVTGRLGWRRDAAAAAAEARAGVRALGLDSAVDFVGPYTQAQAPELFRGAHVLLHPKYNDPCPGVVLEAMACGVPVAYSASGGVPELVGEEAGVGVASPLSFEEERPPDAASFCDVVARILAERARFSAAARRRAAERFDLRPWLERHRRVFQELLARA